jgi:hypothetical protein
MSDEHLKEHVRRYLRMAREALLWKLEGLSEYDARRPLTPTGTNLLGLIKHVTWVEAGYLGEVFGRPFGGPKPWEEPGADDVADMWATAGESRADVVAELHRHAGHADVVRELVDGSAGLVPGNENLPSGDARWWERHRNRLEEAAREAQARSVRPGR